MTNKVYLIGLSGQGDLMLTLVNKAVWDWVNSDYDASKISYYEPLSAEVIAEFVKQGDKKITEIMVTRGSFDNDRAIQAPGKYFSSMKELNAYLKKNNLEIEEEYEGCIY